MKLDLHPDGVSVQDALSVGYLYLLALGIASDSIFYGLLGISILGYSDFLDVLVTPLTYLEKEPLFTAIMFVVPLASFANVVYAERRHTRKLTSDDAYRERLGEEGNARTVRKLRVLRFLMPAIAVMAGYIGYAAGTGNTLRRDMRSGSLRMDHQVTFTDGEQGKIRLVGTTSGYLFYVPEGGTQVAVAPIKETVRRIERLDQPTALPE